MVFFINIIKVALSMWPYFLSAQPLLCPVAQWLQLA